MFRAVLAISLFSSFALASGGGEPGPRWVYQYACATSDQRIKIRFSDTSLYSSGTFLSAEIAAFNRPFRNLAVVANWTGRKVSDVYDQVSSGVPEFAGEIDFNYRISVATPNLGVVPGRVYGYGYYRDSDYHIAFFSNREGESSSTLDIFAFDLKNGTRSTYLQSPCTMTSQIEAP